MSYSSARGSHDRGHDFVRTPQGDAIDRPSFKLFKEVYQNSDDKNVIASPLGVLTLLSMYASATEGEIKEEIVTALEHSNYSQIYDSYGELSRQLFEMDPSFFTFASKIYVSDQYTPSDVFKSTITQSFKSEVERIDFWQTATAATAINHWAEQKTNGHLKNPVPSNAIEPDTVAALINVIYFQGHWNVPFQASRTKDEDFHLDKTTTVKKPTMHLIRRLFYYKSEELNAQLVELPYKETHFRMVVVLPDDINGLTSLVDKVSRQGLLTEVFALRPINRKINLYMPKFEINTGLNLNELLPKIGVSKIFNEPAYGLVKERGVYVSKAFQKAFVKIDEEGATAGAFTGFISRPLSAHYEPPKPLQVKVDHPFLFLILYQDKILFTGTYTH